MPDEDIALLAPRGVHRRFQRGATILNEFDDSGALYVIREGRVKVHVDDDEGREVVLALLRAGDFFGELVITGGPRSASVSALEPTRCFVIPRDDVARLVHHSPDFAAELIHRLVAKVRALSARVVDLSVKDVYARLTAFLDENATRDGPVRRIEEALTQQDIAARIGGSREMVNRILRDLVTGGYISVEARRIALLKPLPPRW